MNTPDALFKRRHHNKIGGGTVPGAAAYDAALNMHRLGPGEIAVGEWTAAGIALPDMNDVRRYRLGRVCEQLQQRGLAGILLYDPLNIRYAADSTNMSLWTMHNAARYCYLSADGFLVVFDYHSAAHLSSHNPLINEVRPALSWFYFSSGVELNKHVEAWADDLCDLIRQCAGGGEVTIAVDRLNPEGVEALRARRVRIVNGEEVMEVAREIKCDGEIQAMRCAMASCERAMEIMYQRMEAGMSENELWGILHYENIIRGGEWIETRILCAGPRTNPWFQESSSRPMQSGELVAFDTDLIGSYGICIDISRTWVVGRRKPSDAQQDLFDRAYEQISKNQSLIRDGLSFREFSEKALSWDPDTYNRYSTLCHGVGLCDEYPSIAFADRWDKGGNDGVFKTGMCVCVESFLGRRDGGEGVKLEEQLLVTDTGCEQLSSFPIGLNP